MEITSSAQSQARQRLDAEQAANHNHHASEHSSDSSTSSSSSSSSSGRRGRLTGITRYGRRSGTNSDANHHHSSNNKNSSSSSRGRGESSRSQEQKQHWARMKEEELVDRMLSQFPVSTHTHTPDSHAHTSCLWYYQVHTSLYLL